MGITCSQQSCHDCLLLCKLKEMEVLAMHMVPALLNIALPLIHAGMTKGITVHSRGLAIERIALVDRKYLTSAAF